MRTLFTLALAASLSLPVAAQQFVLRHGQPISYSLEGPKAPVVATALDIVDRDAREVLSASLTKSTKGRAQVVVRTLTADVADPLAGRHEAFRLENKQGRLYITGSDAHGTAYGLLELSRLMGVSPWTWWADSRPTRKDSLVVAASYTNQQEPAVAYRGIFINDEDWGFTPWAGSTMEKAGKGVIGPKTHAQVFELLLRLRANLFWPAMHRCSVPFYMTKGNREVAERYGITIGTSHCEPMLRNTNGEWKKSQWGQYDYVKNPSGVNRFWEERVKETAKTPGMYTLGMRGIHDTGMVGANTLEEQVAVTQQIIDNQRDMLRRYVSKDVASVPQAFIPYKEVLDIYRAGLRVPDDVTLIWTERTLTLPPSARKRRIKVTAITPAVLLDQITIRADRPLF